MAAAAAAAGDIKVLGNWASPFVMRPRIALNLKNVPYHFSIEAPGTKSELLLQSNPVYKKIPVMLHNGKPICESMIIVEYVDDAFTSGTLIRPSDAYERATERFWTAYIDDKWFGLLAGIRTAKSEEEKKAAIEGLIDAFGLIEDTFQKLSKGKGYFGGDRIGLIDIAFGSWLGWIRVIETMNGVSLIDEAKTPGLHGWAGKFSADAAVKDLMPETEKLLEFAKKMFAPK